MINFFILLFGLVFGSFIAAYSYRYPRGLKISQGTSFCDDCNRKIEWYENIPVVSYFVLGGKCKECKKKISIRYPLIEFTSAFAFYLIYNYFGFDLNLLLPFTLYLLLSLIFIIDFEHQIIPDDFVFTGIGFMFLYKLIFNVGELYSSIASGLIAAFFLLTIYLLTRGRGMGLGDVKFAILGGMIVGIEGLLAWMFGAFLTGATVGIILILIGNAKLKDKIAFGPFLIVAIPIALIWGDKFINLIL